MADVTVPLDTFITVPVVVVGVGVTLGAVFEYGLQIALFYVPKPIVNGEIHYKQ